MDETVPLGKTVTILTVGVAAMSSASVLIRLCPAPAVVIAVYRVALGSVLVLVTGFLTGQRPSRTARLSTAEVGWIAASGFFLAVHFATWISSLDFTSVASSVVLVQTSPVFVALLSWRVLHERVSRSQWGGILLAVTGTLVIAGTDVGGGRDPLKGDLLALVGALAGAGYWICGRRVRKSVDVVTYASLAYAVAAALLLLFAATRHTPVTGFSGRTYLLLLAIAIFPQGFGHTSFNWSLKHLSATAVSVFALGEPVGASLLAWLILSETVPAERALGALLVLGGVALVFRGEHGRGSKS